jgi:hypothetical protein
MTPNFGGRVIKFVPEKDLRSILSEQVDFYEENRSPPSEERTRRFLTSLMPPRQLWASLALADYSPVDMPGAWNKPISFVTLGRVIDSGSVG